MTMPKHSSKSDQSITPSGEFMRLYRRRWVGLVVIVSVLVIAVFVVLKPKTLQVTSALPSGAIAFARIDRVLDHLKSLRSSKFWAGISQVNVPDFLTHEGVGQDKVALYIQWRDHVHDIVTHPAFKQFFGREAAAALYPPMEGFSNGLWPSSFSGIILVARPEAGTRITEALAKAWNQRSKEWKTEQTKYKGATIVSVKINDDFPTVFYVRLHDLIFFAVDERLLHRLVDVFRVRAGAIDQSDLFKETAGRFYPSSGGEVFVDIAQSKEFLMNNLELIVGSGDTQSVQHIRSQLEGSLVFADGVNSFAASFLPGQPLRAKALVVFDPAQSNPELKRLNSCAHVDNPLIAMVPNDVILYQWMGCLDPAAQYRQFVEYKQASSGGKDAHDDPLANLQKAWGLSFEQDILPVLGDDMGWFIQGVDTGGFFPVPKFAVFMKVKDASRAEEILKKIVTTPVTMLHNETYANTKINFVTVPLIQAFKPSFAFVGDYLILATSDRLVKQGLDAASDPSAGLLSDPVFKLRGQGSAPRDEIILFMNLGEIARQCKTLLDWADEWFARKIAQTEADALKIGQELKSLTQEIDQHNQDLIDLGKRLDVLRQEKLSIEAQVKASSVVLEAKNTLAQEGAVQEATIPEGDRPDKLLESKKSQEAAMELEVENLRQEIERKTASRPDMEDDLKDYEFQKIDAQKYRFYINQIVVPIVYGIEALSAQALTTNVKDGVLESELFLSVQ